MPQYFTHYWTGSAREENEEGAPLDHTAGNDFIKRGVKVGDNVYVFNILRGTLYFVGRLTVGEILFSDAAAEKRIGYTPWSGNEHLIAMKATATPMRFQRQLPTKLVKRLEFHSPSGVKGLAFVNDAELDRQALRGVRRLTAPSAKLLEEILTGVP